MTLFMLNRHDQEAETTRELAETEIDTVFGGDLTWGGGDCDPDQTTCDTLTVTPQSDGGWSTDCDAG